jgi:hypothetical protein
MRPEPGQDPIEILEVRNAMGGRTTSFIAIGVLLGKRSDKMKLIEPTPAASLKVIHSVFSSGLKSLPALLGPPLLPNCSEQKKLPYGSPGRGGGLS